MRSKLPVLLQHIMAAEVQGEDLFLLLIMSYLSPLIDSKAVKLENLFRGTVGELARP